MNDASASASARLQLDPQHGLRINGETVKLRGACVHHDNGPLGAATIGRAEERRVELLKAAGLQRDPRSAHNPMSRAMLDACDRLGMLVMDEAFDVWTECKTAFDYSLTFPEWWERDVEAMVAKDFNHPSVIMYSIGNEILEVGNAASARSGPRARREGPRARPTRASSPTASTAIIADHAGDRWHSSPASARTQAALNTMMANMARIMMALIECVGHSSPRRPRSPSPCSTSPGSTTPTPLRARRASVPAPRHRRHRDLPERDRLDLGARHATTRT